MGGQGRRRDDDRRPGGTEAVAVFERAQESRHRQRREVDYGRAERRRVPGRQPGRGTACVRGAGRAGAGRGGDRERGGGSRVMKIKAVAYKDDGKVETTLRFGDNLALVVSAPVRVAIEGDTSGRDEEEVTNLCRELEQVIARELDVRLFELCVEIIRVARGVEMMAAQAVAKEQFTFRDVERLCERHLARRSLAGIG